MKKCRHCGKQVSERHNCEPQKRVIDSERSSFLGGIFDVVGDVVESIVDNLDFD